MQKKILSFLLFVIFGCVYANAQNRHIDSLQLVLSSSKDDTNKVILLNTLCREFRNSSVEKANQYVEEAIELGIKLNYKKGLANSYNNLGANYYTAGNYPEALNNFIKALKIREEMGDRGGMSKTYNNIGLIYYELSNYKLSLDYQFKSLKIKEELKDIKGTAASYGNIGNVYYAMYKKDEQEKDIEEALKYQKLSLKIQEDLGEQHSISASYNNIGNIYFELKNYSLAFNYHQRALKIQRELGDKLGIAHSYINIAGILDKQNKYEEAIKYLQDAVTIAEEIDNKESLKSAYEALSESYESLGDYKNSLKYYRFFSGVKDSVLNAENNRQIIESQTKFDTEKKEKEIEILKKENEIRDLQHSNSQAQLKKEKLIRYSVLGGLFLTLLLVFVIYNRYKIKQTANTKLESAYHQIEHKNKEITDSIRYAKRIQQAILPPDELVHKLIPQSFIIYMPKDIVSGDFYWLEEKNNKILMAAVDCTGHGVPGAFMSIVGYNLINQAVNEHNLSTPALILDELNKGVSDTLRQTIEDSSVKDGMDISLCALNRDKMILEFAGAYNSLYLVRDKSLKEIKGDKFPVGIFVGEQLKHFTNHEIAVEKGDMIYIFTDGYADQFGGAQGKKFKYRQLQEVLINIHNKTMEEQKNILEKTMNDWKGNLEQIDDILICGFRV